MVLTNCINWLCLILVVAGSLMTDDAYSRTPRSAWAKHEFQREHPCPLTGRQTGKCPGYVIDHRIALCVGGKDDPTNMRWQTFDQSILKDRWECRRGWQKKLEEYEANGCFVN